jgi:hypothetical protein
VKVVRVVTSVLVLGLASACSVDSKALPPDGTMDAMADTGSADSGAMDAEAMDTTTGDSMPADAEAPFVTAFVLEPGETTCPAGWDYAGFANSCVGSRGGCEPVSSSFFVDPPVTPWQEIRGYVRGLQGQTPDAFHQDSSGDTLDDVYVVGVSITTETPREHIWTFAAGLHKPTSRSGNACPCDNGPAPPAFVGDQWTCETGNDQPDFRNELIYLSDVLWDADGDAHGADCVPVMEPGWFEARLPAPTDARIEVRIMTGSCDDNVSVTDLELEVR